MAARFVFLRRECLPAWVQVRPVLGTDWVSVTVRHHIDSYEDGLNYEWSDKVVLYWVQNSRIAERSIINWSQVVRMDQLFD